ncbi:hypothetical protein CANCADRAFT_32873 [Tortispora caseinolytica NRRL Y-17796]|uniref:Enoyl reductase (ER) domain-containing protein n=1 Tax=Tortispora caseinolytica NRRL Y-17796 TaxID=767744 RepID=A0A1E4TD51_9ASCO|nr:hypothetical protein CANCADRAFT_32873 [Tortispora caseinolytica NRRL Y-17796]
MKAVVFNGPYDIEVVDRPKPTLQNDTDAIVKVDLTALCGSELHVYRGHQKSDTGFIMGHEFIGTVEEVGSKVTSFKPGDRIVSPFTCSCMQCFYCKHGATSRCEHSLLFGTVALDGAQAEYVRVPWADGTLFPMPNSDAPAEAMVLMADIFPTGYFAALNVLKDLSDEERKSSVNVVVGCGPVGLCTVVAAKTMADTIYAVDTVDDRLEQAQRLGAIPLDLKKGREYVIDTIKSVTEGRGADNVMEIVGVADAVKLAFDLLRPWGKISSIGVNSDPFPFTAWDTYCKNLTIQFGRCPVRHLFPEALKLLNEKANDLLFLTDHIMPLEDAKEGYKLFDERKVQKVIFKV